MSPLLAALLAALAALGAAGLVFALARQRAQLRALLELSSQRLENERVKQNAELSAQRANVERVVEKLAEQLKGYEALVRQFDAERREKYGFLDKSLRDASETTGRLAATTEGLRALLDNSRARGQWGERMADDILRASGLKEGVQYLKNRAQDTSATRPDFTFLLPEGHRLHMDVKFPLDNYLRMSGAAAPEERARFKAEFLRDV
ncbi:MAG: DNA recombination protein RmuC, partial [Elusimicrobia bacterium]|nr:DNA recombination protein RmuC [Elusimicrobiota bacterium]